jgi:hypothetical protein
MGQLESDQCLIGSDAARRRYVRRGYDVLTAGRFVRRAAFAGLTGAGVDDAESTTRGDENVRRPCASKSITVWYSFMLLTVPSPYCACATRSPGVYFSMSSPCRVERMPSRTNSRRASVTPLHNVRALARINRGLKAEKAQKSRNGMFHKCTGTKCRNAMTTARELTSRPTAGNEFLPRCKGLGLPARGPDEHLGLNAYTENDVRSSLLPNRRS